MIGRVIKYIVFLLIAGVVGFIFYKKVYIPKTTYQTLTSTRGDLSVEVYGVGNVGANHIYKITSKIGGKILDINTDEGRWVKKGELLVTFDTVDMPQILEEAKISVDKAKSELVASQKEIKSLLPKKDLAQVTYNRYLKLFKKAFISKAEFDKVNSDLEIINAQIDASKAHITSAKMEIDRAKKSVEAIKEKLKLYKLYSPIDGYVIARHAEIAQSVNPSQTILEIVDPKTVWVKTYIDERISGNVKPSQIAYIKLRSKPKEELKGKVARVVAQSDLVTQEREVDVVFDKLPIPFYINEQAEVKIESQYFKDVVKIPSEALSYYNEKKGVWINQSNKAHFVPLKIVARGSKEIAVEGIEDGSTILIETPKNKPLKEGTSLHQ
ncbi:MAG: efflux RND transporter periplasmic adaptor subunit [Epsilonproteobacteria bacterium]|nr:efflux RND transporter periplasmic adaptor subunit [Campylobacterota bacterium]